MTDRPLVLIPVKSFDLAKSRLAGSLAADVRYALGSALAGHTAWTARDAGADVVIVAGAEEVRHWAQRIGFAAVAQPSDQLGLNGAAAFGAAVAARTERPAYLLHADLPLLTAPVLRRAFRLSGPVIAPSYDGGTTLLGPVPDGFRFAYGVGSYTRHLAALPAASPMIDAHLALDIDSAHDLDRALATRQGRWLLPFVGARDRS
jgi:2-phospho-L-lactate guanylyltransferase